ncbi:MAG TPA: hypothetical protein VGG97_08280 [Bryobacteraceae bacterium]|jgi:hypothetical protein
MLRVLTAVFALLLAAGSCVPVSRLEARCCDASVNAWNAKKTIEENRIDELRRPACPPSLLRHSDYRSRVVAWSSRFTLFQRPPPQNS